MVEPEGPTRAAARSARAAARSEWARCYAPGKDWPCHSPGMEENGDLT